MFALGISFQLFYFFVAQGSENDLHSGAHLEVRVLGLPLSQSREFAIYELLARCQAGVNQGFTHTH